MRIPNFYVDSPLSAKSEQTLEGQVAQHIVKVLRMKIGQKLNLFNGDGFFYHAEIIELGKKSLAVTINEAIKANTESPLYTHIGQVMSRGDRMDYAVQKATEMGVNEITPLTSERCELRVKDDRADKKVAHWQQIAISAAEQCGRARVPKINPIHTVENWINTESDPSTKEENKINLVLHHRDKQHLNNIQTKPDSVSILIGPEGGLSELEIQQAVDQQFIASTFGPRVLRTETAPVTSLALVQWLWGDYQ